MSIIKSIRMICTNIEGNNNKFWDADLHDDGNIYVKYGRVGYSGQEEGPFSGGEAFLEKKIKEKKKKGYVEFKGIAVDKPTVITNSTPLKEIAKKQISLGSSDLEKLIDRLVAANIHNITSNTQIKYDSNSGIFMTPLGVLTPEMITEARNLLALIKISLSKKTNVDSKVEEYLKLVPHNIGMKKLSVASIFPDQNSFDKELNILDSLDASYAAFLQQPKSKESEVVEEKVFDLSLKQLNDQTEFDRITKKYKESSQKGHASGRLKIKNIYCISIKENISNFEIGSKVGNIMELFHGTKIGNLLSIMKKGLVIPPANASYVCGRLYGNGIYGSDQSSKAANYSYGYWSGEKFPNCFLFVADFAMGKAFTPKERKIIQYPVKGYDSTVAIGGVSGVINNEMIVYNTNQVMIKYLIELYE